MARASGAWLVRHARIQVAEAAVKAGLDVWGDPGPGMELMRRLKVTFDPSGIFAPGRFVGGL